jgi:uncharacterized small protein (DUF1192 family)
MFEFETEMKEEVLPDILDMFNSHMLMIQALELRIELLEKQIERMKPQRVEANDPRWRKAVERFAK